MATPPSLPPRGWYPDPGGSQAWRWWDGQRWSDSLEPYAKASSPATTGLLESEQAAERSLVRVGLVLLAVTIFLSTLSRSITLDDTAALMHYVGRALSAAVHHQPQPTAPGSTAPGWVPVLNWLLIEPALIIGIILLLRYQLRAARVAASLGLTQRLSPVLGVAGWFIPVANLVMPYLAWRDLLPRSHALRPRVLWVWLAVVTGQLALLASFPLAATSLLAARIALLASLALLLVALRLAPSVISAIVTAHAEGAGAMPPPTRAEAPGL